MKVSIISEREYNKAAYWHVVHEWEDVFSEYFELECIRSKLTIFKRKLKDFCYHRKPSLFNKIFIGSKSFKFNGKAIKLCFVMNAKDYKLYTQRNSIPIFLDFPCSLIDEIVDATKSLPFFYVTCYALYKEILNRKCENVRYIPLSISDKYYSSKVPEKRVDVIQFGRKNAILHNFMLEYCSKHPDVEYVYQSDGVKLTYVSTQKGDLGSIETRKEHLKFMSECKVSLVSSPAVDGTRNFGEGIDFISPRFYESAVNYCYMLGRYTENEETNMLNLSSVCENIESYEQFQNSLDACLGAEDFNKKHEFNVFLKKNVTSERCKKIKEDIESFKNKL